MMTTCEIVQLGDPALRQSAAKVGQVDSKETRALIDTMQAILANSQGVGLAAPQIGVAKQIIIVASRPTKRYPSAPNMSPTVMINPVYKSLSPEKAKDWEGCLSVPGIRALVPRYKRIQVNYTDEKGNPIEQILEDFVARIFQHEADHLEGKVYLDRVEDPLDIIAETEYFKLFTET